MEISASPPLPSAMKPLHFATSKELDLDTKLGPATTTGCVSKACSLERVRALPSLSHALQQDVVKGHRGPVCFVCHYTETRMNERVNDLHRAEARIRMMRTLTPIIHACSSTVT